MSNRVAASGQPLKRVRNRTLPSPQWLGDPAKHQATLLCDLLACQGLAELLVQISRHMLVLGLLCLKVRLGLRGVTLEIDNSLLAFGQLSLGRIQLFLERRILIDPLQ